MTTQELDEIRPLKKRRVWYRRRDILFIVFIFLIWILSNGYEQLSGPSRITEKLSVELQKKPKYLDLLVTANFPPERFHTNVYNTLGIQRGTKGATTLLVKVTPSDVRWISQQYWIKRIDLAEKKLK
jgi:hypothetical protein|tara:strand:- start:2449 stop:2829 length:381 start_codon:yes stop_codon:yes gene_type:complete